MSEREEWGPWIDHDGKGCPCVGQYVHVVYGDGFHQFGVAGSEGGESWNYELAVGANRIIRYRIRKPRGLTILESLLESLPEEVDA